LAWARRALLLILILGLSLPPAAATGVAPRQQVRIAGVIYLGDLPTMVAEAKGIFARHGLAAEVSLDESGKRNLARLRAGNVDFALMALTPLALDRVADPTPGRADDPVILAGLVHAPLINSLIYPRGGSIRAPADLEGKRVALPLGTNAELLWWLFCSFHAIDCSGVEVQDQGIAEIPALLTSQTVDAAILWEPWLTSLRMELGGELGEFALSDLYAAKWVLVTLRRTASEQPTLCAAVVAAYRDAIELIRRDHDAALAIYAKRAALPVEQVHEGRVGRAFDHQLSLDWSLLSALQLQLRWAQQHQDAADGTIHTDLIDPMVLIDERTLKALMPEAVGIPPPSQRKP
jgi:ABC-type nitrate/sulfonate/bicarbonate transport system substrate-binding protein